MTRRLGPTPIQVRGAMRCQGRPGLTLRESGCMTLVPKSLPAVVGCRWERISLGSWTAFAIIHHARKQADTLSKL